MQNKCVPDNLLKPYKCTHLSATGSQAGPHVLTSCCTTLIMLRLTTVSSDLIRASCSSMDNTSSMCSSIAPRAPAPLLAWARMFHLVRNESCDCQYVWNTCYRLGAWSRQLDTVCMQSMRYLMHCSMWIQRIVSGGCHVLHMGWHCACKSKCCYKSSSLWQPIGT